jgi:hypothetical protein
MSGNGSKPPQGFAEGTKILNGKNHTNFNQMDQTEHLKEDFVGWLYGRSIFLFPMGMTN